MARRVERIGDDIRDIGGHQRLLDALVDPLGGIPIASETVERELLGEDHSGSDLGDPDRLAVQLQPEHMGDHGLGGLGCVVTRPAGVGGHCGGGGDEERVRVAGGCRRLAQLREQGGDEPLRRQDVGLEHPLPVRRLRVLDAVRAARPARDVDERMNGSGLGAPGGERIDVLLTGQVGGERDRAGLALERLQAVSAPGDPDDVPAGRAQRPHHGLADARTRSCHHCTSRYHASTLPRIARTRTHRCYVTFPFRC